MPCSQQTKFVLLVTLNVQAVLKRELWLKTIWEVTYFSTSFLFESNTIDGTAAEQTNVYATT